MRGRVLAALTVLASFGAGCTLVTSLNGLSGGTPPDAGDAASTHSDADDGASDGDDGGVESNDAGGGSSDATVPTSDGAVDSSAGQSLDTGAADAKSDSTAPGMDAGATDAKADSAPVDAGPIATLASGRSSPGGIGVGNGYVYWVEGSAIWRIPTTGGSPTQFSVASDSVSDPFDVAVSSTAVYWTERANAVIAYRSLADGGTRQNLAPLDAGELGFLALSGSTAYATDYIPSLSGTGNVYVDTTTSSGIFSTQPHPVSGIDVRINTVVFSWVMDSEIASSPVGTTASYSYIGSPSSQDIAGLAFDGTDVYYLAADVGKIMRLDPVSGMSNLFLNLGGSVGFGDLATDGANLYWSEPTAGKICSTAL